MIDSIVQFGAVNSGEETRQKARIAILAHDANAIDIIEMLGLEGGD